MLVSGVTVRQSFDGGGRSAFRPPSVRSMSLGPYAMRPVGHGGTPAEPPEAPPVPAPPMAPLPVPALAEAPPEPALAPAAPGGVEPSPPHAVSQNATTIG